MDYKYINQLLERYWNAETTLEEEEILRAFFSQVDIPAELEHYRPLFVYEQTQPKTDVLDEDFDERMLAMIEEPTTKVKARTITMKQRLMPLFKAAAIVAIILTLGNAMQVPFSQQNGYEGTMATTEAGEQGVSVAIGGDSLTVDSMQQSVLQAPAVLQEPLPPTTSD
ncbi:MAG: pyruvate ferredoxin oxidoreductase [Prevotella sp.]|nr:pyruvate ferredoxin oxidoreductase [Prevotella sp.]